MLCMPANPRSSEEWSECVKLRQVLAHYIPTERRVSDR